MKEHFKRSGKSAISIVLSAMILLSAMVINPGIVSVDTMETLVAITAAAESVEDVTIYENNGEATDVQTTKEEETEAPETEEQTPVSSEEEQISAVTVEENTVTVDVTPAEVKSSVMTVEDIKSQAENAPADAGDKKASVKKLPEASKLTTSDTIYFVNIAGWENVYYYNFHKTNNNEVTVQMQPVSTGSLIYSASLSSAVRVSSNTDCLIFKDTGDGVWDGNKTADLKFNGDSSNAYNTFVPSSGATGKSITGFWTTYSEALAAVTSSGTKTVYFDKTTFGYSESWSSVKAYPYYRVTKNSASSYDGIMRTDYWPGTTMDFEDENIYSIIVPSNTTHIVFNNGTGGTVGSTQTTDIELPNNISSDSIIYHTKEDGTVGWEDYSSSSSEVRVRTIYFDDTANWSQNATTKERKKLYIYVKNTSTGAQITDWPGIELSMDKDYPGLYSFSTTEKWSWFKVTDCGSNVTNELTFTDGKVYNNGGLTSLTPAQAAYYPVDHTLTGAPTPQTTRRVYYSNYQDQMLNSDGSIITEDYKEVQSQTDTNGRTWYFVDFTESEVTGNAGHLYFVAADSSGNTLYTGSNVVVKTSSDIALGSGRNDKDSDKYFGETWTKKKVKGVRVYLNSITAASDGSGFYRYTVVSDDSASAGRVHVVAKDGTIRPGTTGDSGYMKYASLADTKIVAVDGVNRASNSSTITINDNYSVDISDDYTYHNNARTEVADIKKGSTIKIRTIINSGSDGNSENYRQKYYVKAFNINGGTYFPTNTTDSNPVNTSGVYECEYTIPASYTEDDTVEITPIYFYNENTTDEHADRDYITFIVENFTGKVVTQWGKKLDGTDGIPVLACYAWYGEKKDQKNAGSTEKNALGGYPGQPMVYENGHYIMQVPKTIDDNSSIQGVTMNNYVWDFVHCDLQGAGYDGHREAINAQSYDYDDFVVLANETDADFIVFRFKYETTKNSYTGTATSNRDYGNKPATDSALTLNVADYVDDNEAGNGWEDYDDYYGNTIDLFNNILKRKDGTVLETAYKTDNLADSYFYVVSDGYRELYYGHFATLWYVYDATASHNFVGAIPSSAFYYSGDMSKVSKSSVPEWFMDNADRTNYTTDDLDDQMKDYWEVYYDLYQSGLYHPVKITYETAIRAMDTGAIIGTEVVNGETVDKKHPQDPGLRNDGNWYYSKATETFTAEIEIQYKSGDNWLVDTLADDGDGKTTPAKKGTVTNAHAYFTNETYTPSTGSEAVAFPGYLLNTASGVSASKENFEFEANEYSEGKKSTTDTTKTMYKFVGWYIDVDGVESELKYSQNDDMAISSKADMRGYTKLIAKYEPYTVPVTLTGEYLTITHELYKSATKFENSPIVLPGSGTPRITAQIIVNGSAVDVPIIQTSAREIKIDTGYLTYYSTGTLKLTLTTTGDSENIYTTTYLKNVADSTQEGAESVVGYVETDVNGTTAYPTGATWTVTEKANDDTTNIGTAVYQTTISSLLDNSSLKTSIIHFYSQLRSTTKFNVTYKFYDREMGSVSQPTDIAKSASSFTTVATANVVDSGNITLLSSAVADGINDLNSKKRVDNVLDQYAFWGSQQEAVEGIQGFPNYHSKSPCLEGTTINETE